MRNLFLPCPFSYQLPQDTRLSFEHIHFIAVRKKIESGDSVSPIGSVQDEETNSPVFNFYLP